jgi:putative transposase
MQKSYISLSAADQEALEVLLHQNSLKSKVMKRVMVLLELHKGKPLAAVQDAMGLSYPTVAKLIDAYEQTGLACLNYQKQPGRPPFIDGKQRALITALACSEAPEGHGRWTLRLLADKVVELGYCETISHEYVGQILKKTKFNHI